MNKNWTIVYKFGDGREVVLEPFEDATEYVFRNLYCRGASGAKIWEAALPSFPDAFSTAYVEDNKIFANTMSGYRLHLDPQTGEEIYREFTK